MYICTSANIHTCIKITQMLFMTPRSILWRSQPFAEGPLEVEGVHYMNWKESNSSGEVQVLNWRG